MSSLRPSLLLVVASCAGASQPIEKPPHVTDAGVSKSQDSGPPLAVVKRETPGEQDASVEAAAAAAIAEPPKELHQSTREGLFSLFSITGDREDPATKTFLENTFGTDGPRKMNQGNKSIARHLIDREKCLENLRANKIVVQTPEQRAKCGGAENMVPIWLKGQEPRYCIDVFEFPNKTCELPFVWTPPTYAKKVCELQGKRLCSDLEWNVACRADPEGGPDQRYAYGDRLDLDACNTNLVHRTACNPRGSATAWDTCSTDTEPSGSYPKCRSRFGVFDQHGNVAEVMTRREGSQVVTQLKGSAWFYVELAKEPDKPPLPSTMNKDAAYPDHCNFDPRWHVEPIDQAGHINYHLGFRCCKSIEN